MPSKASVTVINTSNFLEIEVTKIRDLCLNNSGLAFFSRPFVFTAKQYPLPGHGLEFHPGY